MRKIAFTATLFAAMWFGNPVVAWADAFNYPCQYPGIGYGGGAFGFTMQFCDYPTEANGTHWHCEAGGFNAGGVGLSNGNGISLGAIGNVGGGGEGCSFRCPDGTVAPTPNPPGKWRDYMVARLTFCAGHATPAGPTSELVRIDEGAEPPPPGLVQPGDLPEPQQPPDPAAPQPPDDPGPAGGLPIPVPLPEVPGGVPAIPLPALP